MDETPADLLKLNRGDYGILPAPDLFEPGWQEQREKGKMTSCRFMETSPYKHERGAAMKKQATLTCSKTANGKLEMTKRQWGEREHPHNQHTI